MKGTSFFLGCVLAVAAALAVWPAPAQAITFGFNDEYLISSGTAFSTYFPGATGDATSNGLYQETQTAGGGGIVITRLEGLSTAMPGEFQQNTSLSNDLYINGFSRSLNYGDQVAYVNPSTANPYFRYYTGNTSGFISTSGTWTQFTLNSIDLMGPAGNQVTFSGLDSFANNQKVLFTDTVTLTGSWQTITENWVGIYSVSFGSTNFASMDNVRINEAVPVPLPPSLLLLGSGLMGMGLMGWRRRRSITA